jgi:hypothetical protein
MKSLKGQAMKQIKDLFAPLVGQLVWQVRRGVGSFLTLEFGTPHLSIKEPIAASPDSPPRVRRNLKRRGVYVTGDWHLWVQYGDWTLSTSDGILNSEDPPGSPLDECLRDLDGQRLVSVDRGNMEGSCAFKFDLGGILEIWPSTEIPDDQWGLYNWNGGIITCGSTGVLAFDKADPDGRIFKKLY